MASVKRLCVFAIACLAAVSAFSISYTPQSRGRKLFGGYRIVPKVCQPTNPSRIKSNEPAICMFNYECSRRNGEVVGACMDGFLFGACCQLPPENSQSATLIQANSSPSTENLLNLHEVDHVPDIPILLNPDGTPVGMTSSDPSGTTKHGIDSTSNHLSNFPASYTKISTFSPQRSTQRPSTGGFHHEDVVENAEKPQVPPQADVSHLESDFSALLGQQEVLDDLRLPGLITHSDSNNDIQDHHETSPINPVTTLLSPDQILQIADPVDQLPALFAQGLGQNNHSGADTVLLNENGTYLNENNNPDEIFKPGTGFLNATSDNTFHSGSQQQWASPTSGSSQYYDKMSTPIQQYANIHRITGTNSGVRHTSPAPASTEGRTPVKITNLQQSKPQKETNSNSKTTMLKIDVTTPMSSTYDDDDLVRVPTITYDVQSGNKKHDELDREEIAINHIISILNVTTPSSPTKITQQMQHGSSSIHTWTNVQETSKPSESRVPESRPTTTTETFPYTFYKPGRPTTYYHYDTASTPATDGTSYFSTSSSSSGSSNFYTSRTPAATQGSYGSSNHYDYSTRPSTNPPAPTVIVLGPLGTEYTTVTTQKPSSRRPTVSSIKPSIVTKQPTVGTTITHNISTVISTSNAVTSNNHVVSTSYISINPKPSDTVLVQDAVVADSESTKYPVITKRPSTVWTTLSSWSDKPSFHLKPSKPDFVWPSEKPAPTVVFKKTTVAEKPATAASTTATTTKTSTTPASTICDDETPAPDDLINFPPVRNPNLTQQEKPTIVQTFNDTGLPDIEILNENEIPTPSFIEDDVLTNKVDVFVNKIVQSLQGNFQNLNDVVYNKKNVTAAAPASSVTTKKPPTRKPVKPTPAKPSSQTTRRPPTKKPVRPSGAIQKPAGETPVVRPTKPTTLRPRPTSSASPTTKKPQTVPSKRKPTRKPTTTTTTTTTTPAPEAVVEDVGETVDESSGISTEVQDSTLDYRSECGVRPLIKSGRIVGGKGASFGEWPWQVLVREATWLGLFTKNKCGGVLITNNYVITAAHCQPGFLATLVAVFGEFDISGELESKRSVTRNVRRIIVNRGYNPATFENDLALLELEKPVQFDAHIVPICMPDDGADFTGRMATVTGWGRVKYNGGTPSVLQEVQVPIMENAVCQEMFRTAGHSKLILDSFLCAGYASGQKDSCEGDSGGPLMMEGPGGRWILVGTVSHGIKCAAPYLPGVYMRTTFFKPWLHSVTGV